MKNRCLSPICLRVHWRRKLVARIAFWVISGALQSAWTRLVCMTPKFSSIMEVFAKDLSRGLEMAFAFGLTLGLCAPAVLLWLTWLKYFSNRRESKVPDGLSWGLLAYYGMVTGVTMTVGL